ncbi:MAG: glycosyltransferase family 2 protein [Nakamurella sp.]
MNQAPLGETGGGHPAADDEQALGGEATDPQSTGVTDAGITQDVGITEESAAASDLVEPGHPQPPAPVGDPIATVVIVNYNGAHLLPPCLDGLAAQDMPFGSFRTVVVDNASADPSRDLIREEYPNVDLMVSYRNRGFAGGNNVALDAVTTKYAVLLNNDAIPEPDWLRRLLAPLEKDQTGTLVATSSKIIFMPRFVPVRFSTEPFRPGGLDPRELGVKIYEVHIDGLPVTDKVLFERGTYGPEGTAHEQYRWSRPTGEFLVPLPVSGETRGSGERSEHTVTITTAAFKSKDVTFTIGDDSITVTAPDGTRETIEAQLGVTPRVPTLDVVNNVGGIVFVDGAGADRGFEEVDEGQYEKTEEVFTACGNGVAIRTDAGRAAGWFDDRYFMYYEDVDLSWRLRAAGGRIFYVPDAILRHHHGASSKPWSPSWVFHVERNRLLTLTKDASAGRAAKGVLRFAGGTGKMAARTLVQGVRARQRPALGPLAARGRVLRSYLRLLPGLLADRRRIARTASVPRTKLEEWLVTSR